MIDRERTFKDHVYTNDNRRYVRRVIRQVLIANKAFRQHRYEIHDLAQSTFMDAWRGIEQFRGDAGIQTWLYRIAQNRVMMILRKDAAAYRVMSRKKWIAPVWLFGQHVSGGYPFENIHCSDLRRCLWHTARMFSWRHLQIMRMRFRDEMTFPEIARVVGSTEDTMKNVVNRARPVIRQELVKAGILA